MYDATFTCMLILLLISPLFVFIGFKKLFPMNRFILLHYDILLIKQTQCKAIANGPVGQVLAGPLFLKVKQNSILQKASNKQKY